MTTYTCDVCGKKVNYGELRKIAVIKCCFEDKRLLQDACFDCLDKIDNFIQKMIEENKEAVS